MDEVDIRICQMLMQDSRIPLRELGDKLGLTVAAIHRRVQALQNLGIIRAYTGNLSLNHLGAVPVLVHGWSKESLDDMASALEQDEQTYALLVAAGNYVFVGGYLRNIADLDGYADHVKEICSLESPTVGIEVFGPPGQSRLPRPDTRREVDDIDQGIIKSLQWDSRKPIVDIAKEVGVSSRTVKRRLVGLIRDRVLELVIQWHPDASDDIFSFTMMGLTAEADRYDLGRDLMEKHGPKVVFFRSFGNQPESLMIVTWSRTMKELKGLLDQVKKMWQVRSIVPYIVYTGYRFQTWRDRLLD